VISERRSWEEQYDDCTKSYITSIIVVVAQTRKGIARNSGAGLGDAPVIWYLLTIRYRLKPNCGD